MSVPMLPSMTFIESNVVTDMPSMMEILDFVISDHLYVTVVGGHLFVSQPLSSSDHKYSDRNCIH